MPAAVFTYQLDKRTARIVKRLDGICSDPDLIRAERMGQ